MGDGLLTTSRQVLMGPAIQIAEAVEPIKPLWFEDPLQVEYLSLIHI